MREAKTASQNDRGRRRTARHNPRAPLLDDPRAAFAEADRCVAVAAAMGAEDRLVAVFEEGAPLAGAQGQGAGAVHALLAEAAPAFLSRPQDRPRPHQVAPPPLPPPPHI